MSVKVYQLLICIILIFSFSCVRKVDNAISSTSSEASYSSRYSGGNVVQKMLPDITFNHYSKELPGVSYVSPIVFKDTKSGWQWVYVLVVTDKKRLSLIRFEYLQGSFIFDESFLVEFDADLNSFDLHQMVLSIDNVSGTPYIFVTHKGGLSKIDALTGSIEGEIELDDSGFRVLSYKNYVYFQSSSSIFELDTNLKIIKRSDVSASGKLSSLPIIVVEEENKLYLEQGKQIFCYDISTIFKGSQFKTCDTPSTPTISSPDTHIGLMISHRNKLLYSHVSIINGLTQTQFYYYRDNHGDIDEILGYSASENDIKENTFYDLVVYKQNFIYNKDVKHLSDRSLYVGDYEKTAVILDNNSSILYLPSWSFALNTPKPDTFGIIRVKQVDGKNNATVYWNSPEIEKKDDPTVAARENNFKRVVRFMLYDFEYKRLFSVFNYDQQIMEKYQKFVSKRSTFVCINKEGLGTNDVLDSVGKCKLLEDENAKILSQSVGENVVFLTDDKKRIYYIY
jgi:hypothetical protein